MSYTIARVPKSDAEITRTVTTGGQMPPIKQVQLREEAPTTPQVGEQPKADAPPVQDPRLLELERREIALRREAEQVKADKAAWDAQRAQPVAAPGMTLEEFKAQLLQDPTKLGISYDDIATKYLTQPSEEAKQISALQAQIEELKAFNKKSAEEMDQARTQSVESAKKQIGIMAKRLVTEKAQDYEALALEGDAAVQEIIQTVEQHYQENGFLMSVEEAANKVEQKYLERAFKYAALSKVKAKTATAEPTLVAQEKTQPTQPTLSHSLASGKPVDRMERAKLAFQGKLR